MKLNIDVSWFRALKGLRRPGPVGPDAANMGTAFGLDAAIGGVNLDDDVDDSELPGPLDRFATPAARDWHRRLARRSRL